MFPRRPSGHLAWPTLCVVCRRWARNRICAPCIDRYRPDEATRSSTPLSALVTAVPYAFPWSGLVHAMKYADRPELARSLAPLLLQAVRRAVDPATVDWLVPVPLAEPRARERGYNVPRELARHLAPALGATVTDALLSRCRDTPSQARLSREDRLRNLACAFVVPRAAAVQVRGRTVALVDDVVTTGATLEAAAQALRAAGAAAVHGWVLARTPAPIDTAGIP